MKSLGIEFDASRLHYVLLTGTADDNAVVTSGKLTMDGSRDVEAVRGFALDLDRVLKELAPEVVSVKAKPENGQMRAGASALKMEALVLARSSCPVYFQTSQALSKLTGNTDLYAYQQDAWKAALAGFEPEPKKSAPKAKKPKAKK